MIARLESFIDRFLPKGSALRRVSLVAGGTTIAQGIGIITMPLLSRIYSPADFGVMVVFVLVTSILVKISGLIYRFAIPLPRQERYADALVVLSFLLQALFVVIISLVLLVFGKTILSKFSMDVLIPYQFLIPIGILGTGTYLILTNWAIRKKLFSTIGKTRVTQSLSGALAKIALGFFGLRPIVLLLGSIVSQAGGISTFSFGLVRRKGFPKPRRLDIKRVAIRSAAGNDMRHILKANMSIFLETGLLLVLPIASMLFKLHPVIIGVALLLSLGAYPKRALTSFKMAGGRI